MEQFNVPSVLSADRDSYSAYSIGVLTAIRDFGDDHPEIDSKVSMQARGGSFVAEIANNFDENGVSNLFGEIDIISLMHTGLNAGLDEVNATENIWSHTTGIAAMQALMTAANGNTSAAEIYMSAWGARSWDIYPENSGGVDNPDQNFRLPAAGAALSLFSGMFELGIDYAASWGVGSWGGMAQHWPK